MADKIAAKFKLEPEYPTRRVQPMKFMFQVPDHVVLTVYCNLKKDPQRSIYVDGNSYDYISPWYRTMVEKNLHGIIFYDNLSDDFVQKYETPLIWFIKIKMGQYSINDERFFLYYNFLLQNKNKYKYVLMTDVSDVEINKNPFPFMQMKPELIYVGMNFHGDKGIDADSRSLKWYDRRKWKIDRFNKALGDKGYDMDGFKRDPIQIWSAGILGGHIDIIQPFLSEMCKVFTLVNLNKNTNMLVLNYLLRRYFADEYNEKTACSKYIFSGKPFNSRFQRFEKYGESECYLIHK